MKWIIVTGDTGGLGRAIVECVLQNQDFAVLGISRTSNEFTSRMEEAYPHRYRHLNYDLSDLEPLAVFFKTHVQPVGDIYGLVNNSAYAYDDILTNANLTQLETMFKVNVHAPIMLTKLVIRNMLLHQTEGSIVHISSVSASTGYKGLSMYAATKGALESFSKGVAREWGRKGIRSNCVAPGFMDTAMTTRLAGELKDKIYSRTALQKATDPISAAEAVVFLLMEKSRSMTGTVIHTDNGAL